MSEKWWFDSGLWCNRWCGLFEAGDCVFFVECVATGFCRSRRSTTIWATFRSVKPSAYLNVLRLNLAPSDRDFQLITVTAVFHVVDLSSLYHWCSDFCCCWWWWWCCRYGNTDNWQVHAANWPWILYVKPQTFVSFTSWFLWGKQNW